MKQRLGKDAILTHRRGADRVRRLLSKTDYHSTFGGYLICGPENFETKIGIAGIGFRSCFFCMCSPPSHPPQEGNGIGFGPEVGGESMVPFRYQYDARNTSRL